MARPKDKEELLKESQKKFEQLFEKIEQMSEEEQNQEFVYEDRDKNIRDVLVHLYEWHLLLINWIQANKKGDAQNFLPSPYTWKSYPEMNIKFREKHQHTPLEKSKKLLKESHAKIMELIKSFSEKELFTKKHFSWTGSTSLGSYSISASSSHYERAIKKIKKQQKLKNTL